jgi:hypothetical protein
MGYVPPSLATIGEKFGVGIRDKRVQAEIVKLPFYQRKSESQVVVLGEEMELMDFRKKYSSSSHPTLTTTTH